LSVVVQEGPAPTRRPGGWECATSRIGRTVALGALAAALLPVELAHAQLFPQMFGSPYGYQRYAPPPSARPYYRAPRRKKTETPAPNKKEVAAKPPAGPLLIAVALNSQRVTLYSNGVAIAHSPISTGTASHPTPTGIFSIIQKSRYHRSNLYSDAPMPYMQRITWSGVALHQGVLPGYPASHGCIRLPEKFAQYLWGVTRMGARVIVTREDATPAEIAHATLFAPKPKTDDEPLPPAAEAESMLVKVAESEHADRTSDAMRPTAAALGAATPGLKGPLEPAGENAQPRKSVAAGEVSDSIETPAPSPAHASPAEAAADRTRKPGRPASAELKETPRMSEPVSVFVSRKAGRLYVRQGFEPLFDVPVTIKDPNELIGTHLYTAVDYNEDRTAMKWSAVTLPTRSLTLEIERRKGETKEQRNARAEHEAKLAKASRPSAAAALERIEMPQDAVERISELMSPGSSLIISDYPVSGETGKYTDFIILTR
jgi:lipoprotein-anchoring transpeptidase ErfK/SrfK